MKALNQINQLAQGKAGEAASENASEKASEKQKIVLAYSGGLDTSVILTWLKEEFNYSVIAVCVDLGQQEDYEALIQKGLKTGADSVIVVDAVDAFVEEYAFMGLKAGAIYEGEYLLGTAFARPLIAKHLVEIALKEGAIGIAHGATGKGNDQVRFEATIKALAPQLEVIAPWRQWSFKSREDLMNYAAQMGIPVPNTPQDPYSRDENLWHISHEGGLLEDPWNAHCESLYRLTKPIGQVSSAGDLLTLTFKEGTPVAIDGKELSPRALLENLNRRAGLQGIGVVDLVENRLVGMKSRGVYETPGGTVLYKAHSALERLVLDRETLHVKTSLSLRYADLVYNGLWFSPLKAALDAFVEKTQQMVTGTVRISLAQGHVRVLGSKSPFSLYSEAHVTFGEDHVYNQSDAQGFINLFTLPLQMAARVKAKEHSHEL